MTVPMLGPLTASGFAHKWCFLFLLVVLGLVGLYVGVQLSRHKRMLRFANMELLDSVSPNRPSRWRHLAAILLLCSLLLLTVGLAGPTRDVRIPRNRAVVMLVIDGSPSMRATDVSPSRLAAAEEAGKQFASRRRDAEEGRGTVRRQHTQRREHRSTQRGVRDPAATVRVRDHSRRRQHRLVPVGRNGVGDLGAGRASGQSPVAHVSGSRNQASAARRIRKTIRSGGPIDS